MGNPTDKTSATTIPAQKEILPSKLGYFTSPDFKSQLWHALFLAGGVFATTVLDTLSKHDFGAYNLLISAVIAYLLKVVKQYVD